VELGDEVEDPSISAAKMPQASTDFAEVTHALPALQTLIRIAPKGIVWHNKEFADAAKSPSGHKGLETGTKCLAMAAAEIFSDPNLLSMIKKNYRNSSH
jgi:hypothetical protein